MTATPNPGGEGAPAPGAVSRRAMLATTAQLAAAAALGGLAAQGPSPHGPPPQGVPAPGAPTPATPPGAPGLETFMAVSRRLTGKRDLDPVVGARLHAALTRAYPDLPRTLAPLDARLAAADSAAGTPLARAPEPERRAAQRILRGWYLGVVGTGPGAQCVAFETILAYRPVADQIVMHTFCREAPGYWAEPPSAVQAARA